MKIQYASFLLPLTPNTEEQEELNRFLRGHRIVQTRKELVTVEGMAHWGILAEYLDRLDKSITAGTAKSKIDYKEILNASDFSLFSRLREIRKKLSEENGIPVYAVCTNEQLAELAKLRPKNLTECKQIDGIGQGKAEKYIPALLECIGNEGKENPA